MRIVTLRMRSESVTRFYVKLAIKWHFWEITTSQRFCNPIFYSVAKSTLPERDAMALWSCRLQSWTQKHGTDSISRFRNIRQLWRFKEGISSIFVTIRLVGIRASNPIGILTARGLPLKSRQIQIGPVAQVYRGTEAKVAIGLTIGLSLSGFPFQFLISLKG